MKHGKLIIALFENGQIAKGYAIENKKGPYNRLAKTLEEHHLLDDIIPLFSDGISDLPNTVDTVIIAGLGGNNIINILKAHPQKLKNVKTIIADAHNAIPEMRREVCNMGFVIADEDIVYEKEIYYEVIKFVAGEVAYLEDPDIEFGPKLRTEKSVAFKAKYMARLKDIDNLLSTKNLPASRIEELNAEKERIKNVL